MAFDWGYFFSLFSIGAFWQACVTVIVISTLSWGIGLVVGFLLACAKLSAPRWVKIPVELYIWFFRSVPLMVLLVFVYNLPQLFPVTQPLLGVPFIAGLVSMTVTEAAYMAEIHRGGLLSVAKGQSEAGHALSFSFIGIQRLIVIPQAFRISLPTLINEYITIIKLDSVGGLLTRAAAHRPALVCAEFPCDGDPAGGSGVLRDGGYRLHLAVPGAGKSSRYSA